MDRLTQLQFLVLQLEKEFYSSVGFLQQFPNASDPNGVEAKRTTDLFVTNTAKLYKELNRFIKLLPSAESDEQSQKKDLIELEKCNSDTKEKLQTAIDESEELLKHVREALHKIAGNRGVENGNEEENKGEGPQNANPTDTNENKRVREDKTEVVSGKRKRGRTK
eukprot:m.54359 g.54359  ORF g.54359 m.54359 type:complete len:165 (-) comp10921_c1_seq2:1680-2174(-)